MVCAKATNLAYASSPVCTGDNYVRRRMLVIAGLKRRLSRKDR